jgi:hypothetical protein
VNLEDGIGHATSNVEIAVCLFAEQGSLTLPESLAGGISDPAPRRN